MGPVVQQLLTLAGVVLGAGASYSAAALMERAKWRRSRDTRWDDKRLVAYSEYANALKRYAMLSYRLAAARGYPASVQPIEIDEGLRAMAEADADKSIKWESLLLLGSPEAVTAARSWTQAAWQLSYVAGGQAIDHEAFIGLFEEMGRRRNEFYECARSDLGVKSGVLPPGDQAWVPPSGEGERSGSA